MTIVYGLLGLAGLLAWYLIRKHVEQTPPDAWRKRGIL